MWELALSYAVSIHSYTGFAAAAEYGEKSVIATDLIDYIGEDSLRIVLRHPMFKHGGRPRMFCKKYAKWVIRQHAGKCRINF